jgi:hypothetical protein
MSFEIAIESYADSARCRSRDRAGIAVFAVRNVPAAWRVRRRLKRSLVSKIYHNCL